MSGNFTDPYGNTNGNDYVGEGDNGEIWDPHGGPNGTGAWVPNPNARGAGPNGLSVDGHGVSVGFSPYATSGSPTVDGNTTLGKVGGEGEMGSYGAWGGYTGKMVDDGHGGIIYDPSQSGRADDVNRLRTLGAQAGQQAAYQLDYSKANGMRDLGAQDRGLQGNAIGLARTAALGGPSAAQDLNQRMTQQGMQAQQAAALSARGGSLAQAAAMRQQQSGEGAYLQQSQNQLQALRADEMASGRAQWGQAAGQQRALDATSQGLAQSQATNQANLEMGQRQLNQTGQMGYEQMAQDVNKAAASAALSAHELDVGIDGAAQARASRNADRDLGYVAAGVGAGGALASGIGEAAGGGGGGQKAGDPDPYSQAVSLSDERAKTRARPLGLAAAAVARRVRQ